jgi:hypothetical protein
MIGNIILIIIILIVIQGAINTFRSGKGKGGM